jgi:uncharacterized protein (DUF433 family)
LFFHRLAVVSGESEGGSPVFDRITFDPKVVGGRACIRGMRIPVSVIVSQVAQGATIADILQGYPDLERQDIQQALEYAAWLTREEVRSP